jgi:hypothetical protein
MRELLYNAARHYKRGKALARARRRAGRDGRLRGGAAGPARREAAAHARRAARAGVPVALPGGARGGPRGARADLQLGYSYARTTREPSVRQLAETLWRASALRRPPETARRARPTLGGMDPAVARRASPRPRPLPRPARAPRAHRDALARPRGAARFVDAPLGRARARRLAGRDAAARADVGDVEIARLARRARGRPPAAHCATTTPSTPRQLRRRPVARRGRPSRGPGVLDMKAGIVAAIARGAHRAGRGRPRPRRSGHAAGHLRRGDRLRRQPRADRGRGAPSTTACGARAEP